MTRGHPAVDFEERGALLREKGEELAASGVKLVQMEFTDVNGHVRGKVSPLNKALSPSGFGVSTLIQTILSKDQVCLTPYSTSTTASQSSVPSQTPRRFVSDHGSPISLQFDAKFSTYLSR